MYQRCKDFNQLPYDGGLMAQPEWLLDLFDIIEEERGAIEREMKERAEMEYKRQQMLGQMSGGAR